MYGELGMQVQNYFIDTERSKKCGLAHTWHASDGSGRPGYNYFVKHPLV